MKEIMNTISKLFDFKFTLKGVGLLLLGGIIGVGVDYFLNPGSDYRLMIFIIGCSIFSSFLIHFTWLRAKSYFATIKAVKKLTLKECEYALKCDKGGQIVVYDLSNTFQVFVLKWKYILFVPTPKYLVTEEEYLICTRKPAIKLIEKRLKKHK